MRLSIRVQFPSLFSCAAAFDCLSSLGMSVGGFTYRSRPVLDSPKDSITLGDVQPSGNLETRDVIDEPNVFLRFASS